MSKTNKIVIGWWVLATILLGCLFFAFYGDSTLIATKLLLTLGGSALVVSLLLFETKVHISLPLIFISELCNFGASIAANTEGQVNINADLILSIIGIFSGAYLVIRALKKENKELSINNIIKQKMQPFNVPLMVKLIILACMVSAIFTMANVYRTIYEGITWVSILYVLFPTFIILLSIVPLRETVYLRVIYYLMWIMLVQMAHDTGTASLVSMTEPFIYLITVIFGRIYRLGSEIDQHTDENKAIISLKKGDNAKEKEN